jgi:hypothetical protein
MIACFMLYVSTSRSLDIVSECFSGASFATFPSFYGLQMAVFEEEESQFASASVSYARTSYLVSIVASALLGVLLLVYAHVSLMSILLLSVVLGISYCFLVPLTLPQASQTSLVNASNPNSSSSSVSSITPSSSFLSRLAVFKVLVSSPHTFLWFLYLIVSTAVHSWVLTFWQALAEPLQWQYNGFVVAASFSLSTVFAAAARLVRPSMAGQARNMSLCALLTLSGALLMIALSYANVFWILCLSFAGYHALFQAANCITLVDLGTAVASQHVGSQSVIFLLANVFALGLQSFFQLVLGTASGMAVDVQFRVLGVVLAACAVLWALCFRLLCVCRRRSQPLKPATSSESEAHEQSSLLRY